VDLNHGPLPTSSVSATGGSADTLASCLISPHSPDPSVLQPLFLTGHGDKELERAGTPGTPVPS